MRDTLCQEGTLYAAWNHIRSKGAVGGVDGVSIESFHKTRRTEIPRLANELRQGTWKPQPYMEIEVAKAKHPDEMRRLGMTAIRDKVVQQAIKQLIEPRLERLFRGCSYGFRPGKGAVKAIRRVLAECRKQQARWVLRLDIDNFFDNIDQTLLQQRLAASGLEAEMVRLVMLCVQMGRVRGKGGEWVENPVGVPQGAILSPLLSNLYLNSFDQFAESRGLPYVRYADDFLFICPTEEMARDTLQRTETHLHDKLHLVLNQPPIVAPLSEGFDFLGITVKNATATITIDKREELCQRIWKFELTPDGLDRHSRKAWDGMANYYAKLLPQDDLEHLDSTLMAKETDLVRTNHSLFTSQAVLRAALAMVPFLSQHYQKLHKQITNELVGLYAAVRQDKQHVTADAKNKKIIQQRKQEYRRREAEASGLLVNKAGTFIGLTSRGVTVSHKGHVLSQHHPDNLSQIVVTGMGVSLSSNLAAYCLSRRIPIDFFDTQGTHLGSIISARSMQNTLWREQAVAPLPLRNTVAQEIIEGKIKNQFALIKYYHKYHKSHYPILVEKMAAIEATVIQFKEWNQTVRNTDDQFIQKLIGHESQMAIRYWDYLRELVADDDINFTQRVHRGATDLMNSMLNYGYAILYVRVWQALLAAGLNPFEGLIHTRAEDKQALVFDMVEIFRSQVVDRVVVSLIQKGHELEVRNGLLADGTRQLLVKSVMERLSRYEKYQGADTKMENIILHQAKLLAKTFVGEARFKPYVAKW